MKGKGMITLADFKREVSKPGAQLEILAMPWADNARMFTGLTRHVSLANSIGIYLATEGIEGKGSFLGFGSAKEWNFNGDIATNECGLAYRVITQ